MKSHMVKALEHCNLSQEQLLQIVDSLSNSVEYWEDRAKCAEEEAAELLGRLKEAQS